MKPDTLCEAPVIVKVTSLQAVVEPGQNCSLHLLPEGVMLVLLGTATPVNDPAASKDPEIT
jgi:hypothetical protein